MKKNLTELVFILDRSGSMYNLTNDTIGGFNSMIDNQKNEPGEAYITTVLFDDQYELLHDHLDIQAINHITDREYYARGCTALLDAVGKTINSVGIRLHNTDEDEKPEKVVFVIVTDGMENASKEFHKTQIKEMIDHQQTKYSWTFIFLGANMDAVSEAASIGINTDFARTYTADNIGTKSVYNSVSAAIDVIRGMDLQSNVDDYNVVMSALNEIK